MRHPPGLRSWQALVVVVALVACDGGVDVTDAALDDAGADAADAADVRDAAPTPPYCCTPAVCAAVGAACEPRTCRCEAVRCEVVGAPCDPDTLPGVRGDIVCAATAAGGRCHVRVGRPEDCPSGIAWCAAAPEGCLCGYGCRFFADDCPAGIACRLHGDGPDPTGPAVGTCRGLPGAGGEGDPCGGSEFCGAGLVCSAVDGAVPRCVRPGCGLAEGAPSCPEGRLCLPFDAHQQMGVCRVGCDVFDPQTACAANEVCAWRGVGPRGVPGGACRRVADAPLPSLGQRCDGFCRVGYACVEGVCLDACDPAVAAPTGPAACPAGQRCVRGYEHGACAAPCDPWPPTVGDACPPGYLCAVGVDDRGAMTASCLPRRTPPSTLDQPCWSDCASGLACSGGYAPRCRPLCRPGAAAGVGACPAGERCFALYREGPWPAPLPYGFCARPCVPGGADCADGVWCEPRELDPTTRRWVGTCH